MKPILPVAVFIVLAFFSCTRDSGEGHTMPAAGLDLAMLPQDCGSLRNLLLENPSNAELHFRLAGCAYSADSLDWAMTEINKALELDAFNARFSVLKSKILHKKGELKEAIDEAENAQSLDANDPEFYSYMSQLYLEVDSLQLAKEYLVEASLMAPDWNPVLQAKARFYRKSGEVEQSITESRKALFNDRADSQNYLLLAQGFLAAGRADSARKYTSQGLELTGYRDPLLLLIHADLLVNIGKEDSAIAVYKRALQISPKQQKINIELAEIYMRRGQLTEASRALESYLEMYPSDTTAYLRQGYCFEKLGQWNKAQELYVKASVKFPQNKAINEAKERVVNMLTRTYSQPVL